MIMRKDEIVGLIMANAVAVIQGEDFESWVKTVNPQVGDFIVFNNSFMYRDGLTTNKSHQYLAVKYPIGPLDDQIYVLTIENTVNSDYKIFSAKSGNFSVQPIEDAIGTELDSLGDVIFVLIGILFDDFDVIETLDHEKYKKLKYEPKFPDLAEIRDGSTILIGDYRNEERLWNCVETLVGDEVSLSLKGPFSKALKNIKKLAVLRLELPQVGSSGDGQTMLGELEKNLSDVTRAYKKSLGEFAKDQSYVEYNNLLRISYNFSSDAIRLIKLLISACDLKPILQWCTLSSHYKLAKAFRNLPWTPSKQKPSFKEYINTIGGARNHAFHDFFGIDKPIQVGLQGMTLKAHSLTLFSGYKRQQDQHTNFDYQDRALVELLTQFTIAPEEEVSSGFWDRNLLVMLETVALIEDTSRALAKMRLLP